MKELIKKNCKFIIIILIVLSISCFGIYINFKEKNNNKNELGGNTNIQEENKEQEIILPIGKKLSIKTTTCSLGDFNNDGKINSTDVDLLNKNINGKTKELFNSCGDLDNNGKLTKEDYNLLKKYVDENSFTYVPLSKITYNESTKTKKSCLLGDVNNDGKVTSQDASKISQVLAGTEKSSKIYEVCGDVNNDGKLTKEDSDDILKYIVNSFPKHAALEKINYTNSKSGSCKLGDLTGDEKIDENDLTRLKNVVTGSLAETVTYKTCGDINGDHTLNNDDINILQKYLEWIVFPKGEAYDKISYNDHAQTKSCKLGDLDNDNKVNAIDANIITKVVEGVIENNSIYSTCGDVNNDGKLTDDDRELVRLYAAKLITEFPKGEALKEISWVEEITLTCKLGDVTNDGKIDSNDVSLVKSLVSTDVTTKPRLPYVCGDVDGNGELSENDYILLNKYISVSNKFPDVENEKMVPLLKIFYNSVEKKVCNFGDLNNDSDIDIVDSYELRTYINGINDGTKEEDQLYVTCGDIDGNNKLDEEDINMLRSYIVKSYEFIFGKGRALTNFEYEETIESKKTCKFGDLNNDGKINSNDITQLNKLLKDKNKQTKMYITCGDINGNNKLDEGDKTILSNYVSGDYKFIKGNPLAKITYITTELSELQNMIVSDNKKYGLYYEKVSVNDKDNTPLITLNIGDYVRDNKIDLNNTTNNGSYDNTYKLSSDNLNKYMNSKYNTNISYTTTTDKLFLFDGGYAEYENGIYYLSKNFAGSGYSYDIKNEIIKGEIVGNKIYLYDIALIKYNESGTTSYTDSFDSDKIIYECDINTCSLDDDAVFNKYKDKLSTYKHTFNMLEDGTIYYLETQKIN